MNKSGKIIAMIVSAILIVMTSVTVGLSLNEKKQSVSNSNSTKNREIEIKDTCEEGLAYPQAIEKYYEDEKYVCSFNVIKSGCYIVKLDGKEYPLKDALNNKVITIEEGIEHGLRCERKDTGIADNKESKNLVEK